MAWWITTARVTAAITRPMWNSYHHPGIRVLGITVMTATSIGLMYLLHWHHRMLICCFTNVHSRKKHRTRKDIWIPLTLTNISGAFDWSNFSNSRVILVHAQRIDSMNVNKTTRLSVDIVLKIANNFGFLLSVDPRLTILNMDLWIQTLHKLYYL